MRVALRAALWAVSIASVLVYLALAIRRMVYPLELDCIEGVMLDHVRRLAAGQPIFVEPSLGFIPLAYMPGFATASALVARFAGTHFWVPRLISVAATLGIMGVIACVVRAETRSWTAAVAGAGLYAMAFGLTGGCYDVARPDSLMLLLAFGGLATLRFTRGAAGAIAAALLLTVAFFTKQHAAWFVLASLAHLAWNDRRRLGPFALAIALGCGGGYALLAAWLGPWYRFFTLEVPSGWSELSRGRILTYLGHGVFGTLALLSVPVLLSLARAERPWRGPSGIWMWAGLGAIGTGLLATLDPSAYRHVMIPTMVTLAILGPISLARVSRDLESAGAGAARVPSVLFSGMLLLQFVPLLYPVRSQMPHPHAAEAHAALLGRLRSIEGVVLMPYHGFYLSQAGKPVSLQIIALDDILRARGNRLLARDPRFLDRMFEPLRRGPHRPAIVTDIPLERGNSALWRSLAPVYALADTLGWISEPLRPVTGNPYAPRYLYLPVEPAASEAASAPASAPGRAP
jgi:hypothetical protein